MAEWHCIATIAYMKRTRETQGLMCASLMCVQPERANHHTSV